jgi:hypothetical protein
LPHVPQLALSFWRFRHVEPHSVRPAVVHVQVPVAQFVPDGQTFAHAPQLVTSLLGVTHVLPQRI